MGTPVVPYVAPPRVFATPAMPQQYMYQGVDGLERYAAAMAEYNKAVEGVNSANNAAYQAQVGSGTTLEQARLAAIESDAARTAGSAETLLARNAGAAENLLARNAAATESALVRTDQSAETLLARNAGAAENLLARNAAASESLAERGARATAQTNAETYGASESAFERQARVDAAKQASIDTQALESLRNTGAMGLDKQTNEAQLAQIKAQIDSQKALQTGAQTFGASESAAERAARVAELTQSSNAAQSLEALRTAGAKDIGAQANAAELQRLQTQIAATGGQATTAQAAEMARLQAQLGSAASLQSSAQTFQQQTEEQRYMRSLAEQNNANARMDTVMGKFGFTGATPTGGAAGADPYASGATDTQELDAENAAFAWAKDKIGLASRAASNSLSSEMAARGITGSGIEAQQLGLASDQAVGQIGDTAREQALASLQRRYQVSDRNAALTSTKRAQDIGLVQSLASLAKPTGGAAY